MIRCPHCHQELDEREVRSLWGALTSSMRKKRAAGPGRPKKLRRCSECGTRLGVAEMRSHKCGGSDE